jgi:hypothetical protein
LNSQLWWKFLEAEENFRASQRKFLWKVLVVPVSVPELVPVPEKSLEKEEEEV